MSPGGPLIVRTLASGLKSDVTGIHQADSGLGHQHIRRLQIAMQNAALVRGFEGARNLNRDLEGLLQRQRPTRMLPLKYSVTI